MAERADRGGTGEIRGARVVLVARTGVAKRWVGSFLGDVAEVQKIPGSLNGINRAAGGELLFFFFFGPLFILGK